MKLTVRSAIIHLLAPAVFILMHIEKSNGQTSVIMQHNNLKRTGWNNTETILTQNNVSSGNFGKIFARTVDDQIYTQPLIVSNLKTGGHVHNVVFVETVNNSVYAFDADDPLAAAPLWHVNLTYPGYRVIRHTDMTGACGGNYNDFSGNMGIVGTPTIDTSTRTMYVVARSVSTNGQTFVQYLHAISIITGAERPGSPVFITATVNGNGDGSVGGKITFNQQTQNQRPALLLYNGIVYIGWSSHCDWGPYHGWLMGYDAATLQRKYIFNDTPLGGLAGIWMSGQAPAVDDNGFIYLSTGNGTVGKSNNPNDTANRGESLLKLSTASGKLKVVDFFTPNDYPYLEANDLDYGVDGVMLIPNSSLSLSGSKESYLYLINNTKMGGMNKNNANVQQFLNINASSTDYAKHLHGSPVYLKDQNNKEYIYAWAEGGHLKQFTFNRLTKHFDTLSVKVGLTTLPNGMPGGMVAVSSNGQTGGTGILWASHPSQGDANQSVVPGVLQAFDATDITHELWNSNLNGRRDTIGKFAKFVVPTIANGKVYMATFSNQLAVYGLNPPDVSSCTYPLQPPWQSADIGFLNYPGNACDSSGTFTIQSSGDDIWGNADGFYYVYQPLTANNAEIKARVKSMMNTDPWAKCGVMFRSNLDPSSPHTFMALTVGNGRAFQDRLLQGGDSYNNNNGGVSAPYWVRLVKKGDKYTGYTSVDGVSWFAVDSVNVPLGTYMYAGIAYTAHNNNAPGTAIVDNVTFSTSGLAATDIATLYGKNVNNEYAELNWPLGNEMTTADFQIERSNDGIHYINIGTVAANSFSEKIRHYIFTDPKPQTGGNLYRIKQISKDGSVKFSNTLKLSFNVFVLNVFPNPAKDQLLIRYYDDLGAGSKITIRLINNVGQTVYNEPSSIPVTSGTIVIDLPPIIKSGVYILQIINAKGDSHTKKLVIER